MMGRFAQSLGPGQAPGATPVIDLALTVTHW